MALLRFMRAHGMLTPKYVWLIALLIRRDSEGPVFFRQVRLGLNMCPFTALKFRTMRLDADEGCVFTGGDAGPFSPYLPSGAYL